MATVSREFATAQVERLGGLRNYDKLTTSALLELVTALAEAAPDEPAAAQFITDWLAESNICPRPADIRRSFRREPAPPPHPASACPKCHGYGWISREVNGVWGSKRCDCRP